jgi:hypothetical protein
VDNKKIIFWKQTLIFKMVFKLKAILFFLLAMVLFSAAAPSAGATIGPPSGQPTGQPTSKPTSPTGQPTSKPSAPTGQPTGQPSGQPTSMPSRANVVKIDYSLVIGVVVLTFFILVTMLCVLCCAIDHDKGHCCNTCARVDEDYEEKEKRFGKEGQTTKRNESDCCNVSCCRYDFCVGGVCYSASHKGNAIEAGCCRSSCRYQEDCYQPGKCCYRQYYPQLCCQDAQCGSDRATVLQMPDIVHMPGVHVAQPCLC